jgi:serine/threonine protein kinase
MNTQRQPAGSCGRLLRNAFALEQANRRALEQRLVQRYVSRVWPGAAAQPEIDDGRLELMTELENSARPRRTILVESRMWRVLSEAITLGRRKTQADAAQPLSVLAEARLGHVLRGKYRLERVLGVGGMAAVYAATHRNRRRFAIKMLHPELSLSPAIRSRFQREGYVTNTVNHVGAVAVLDDDVAEDGSAFLVMELLDGMGVDALQEMHGPALPVTAALAIADQLLDVLVAAHEKGIVHRDLKPANLFVTREGKLKVLDFGIAHLREAHGGEATLTGTTLGTPAYMAPEQAFGKVSELDAKADLWAVGATLFALISGEFVHEGASPQQLLALLGTRPARSLGSVAPAVPEAVAQVIDRALSVDKHQRWPSAAAMRDALRQAQVEAFGSAFTTAPERLLADFLVSEQHHAAKFDRSRQIRGWAWLAVALLLIVVLSVAVVLASGAG